MELSAGTRNGNPYDPEHMKKFGPDAMFLDRHISRIAEENLPGYVEATGFNIASCVIFGGKTGTPWIPWKRNVRLFVPPTSLDRDRNNFEYTMIVSNFFFNGRTNVNNPQFKGVRTIKGGKEIPDDSADYRRGKNFLKSVPALVMYEEFDSIDSERWCTKMFEFSPRTMYHRARLAVLCDPDYPTDSVTLIVKLPMMSTEVNECGKVIHFSTHVPRSIFKGLSTEYKRLFEESHKYGLSSNDADNSIILALVKASELAKS